MAWMSPPTSHQNTFLPNTCKRIADKKETNCRQYQRHSPPSFSARSTYDRVAPVTHHKTSQQSALAQHKPFRNTRGTLYFINNVMFVHGHNQTDLETIAAHPGQLSDTHTIRHETSSTQSNTEFTQCTMVASNEGRSRDTARACSFISVRPKPP